MKASELLARYREGERNFQRVSLRGQSFKGKDLSGADFSEADIRGTNFRGAILQGTKFCRAKAGLQRRWLLALLLFSLVLVVLSGFFSIFFGLIANLIFDPSLGADYRFAGWFGLATLMLLYGLIFRQGWGGAEP